MEPLIIQSTFNTPNVRLNHRTNKFMIQGASLPENIRDFYNPIIEWFQHYMANPNPETIIELDFNYLNTASSKMMTDILRMLDEYHTKGIAIKIHWYYDLEDAEIKEFGEDLEEFFGIPFDFVLKD